MKAFAYEIFGILLMSISSLASASTSAEVRAQFLAAQDETVQKIAALIAESNPEIANQQCDLNPSSAIFPKELNGTSEMTLRFKCVTNLNYKWYIEMDLSLFGNKPSVAIISAKVISSSDK